MCIYIDVCIHTQRIIKMVLICVCICYGNSLCLRYIIETAAIRSSLHFLDQAALPDALVDIQ